MEAPPSLAGAAQEPLSPRCFPGFPQPKIIPLFPGSVGQCSEEVFGVRDVRTSLTGFSQQKQIPAAEQGPCHLEQMTSKDTIAKKRRTGSPCALIPSSQRELQEHVRNNCPEKPVQIPGSEAFMCRGTALSWQPGNTDHTDKDLTCSLSESWQNL
ncbi:uncharacterized protein LOC144580984 isoform X1 [Callithrix jacchus]